MSSYGHLTNDWNCFPTQKYLSQLSRQVDTEQSHLWLYNWALRGKKNLLSSGKAMQIPNCFLSFIPFQQSSLLWPDLSLDLKKSRGGGASWMERRPAVGNTDSSCTGSGIWVPGTHMLVHNYNSSSRGPNVLLWPSQVSGMRIVHIHTRRPNTHT